MPASLIAAIAPSAGVLIAARIMGGVSPLGPLVSGWLRQSHAWESVVLVTLPLAIVAHNLALILMPNHVNETSDPVDKFGGILSVVLSGTFVVAINFAPVPG